MTDWADLDKAYFYMYATLHGDSQALAAYAGALSILVKTLPKDISELWTESDREHVGYLYIYYYYILLGPSTSGL